MQNYAPHLASGQLSKEQQDRFFHCVWGVLDLIVVKRMIVHDDSRDHFTREEIFRLFNVYFEYDEETALKFRDFIFVAKKILVGGSSDKLKDKELAHLFNLIYDYRDAYYIIHKQLPLLRNAGQPGHSLSEEQKERLLKKFKRSLQGLQEAYQRENVVYTLSDLNHDGEYLNTESSQTYLVSSLFQGLFEGVLFPQTKIEAQGWDTAFKMIYKGLNLYLYYKTHFKAGLTAMEKRYVQLQSAQLFLDIISENPDQGFPVKALDKILLSAVGLLEGQSPSLDRWLSRLKNPNAMALITRSIVCFSLKRFSNCGAETDSESSPELSQVQTSFPDTEFSFSEGQLLQKDLDSPALFLTPAQIQYLQQWLTSYQEGIQHIYYGWIQETAVKHQFDQWLDPFFGWDAEGQIIFGSFDSKVSAQKSFWLLENQRVLSFFLGSYLPEDFFSSTQSRMSVKLWNQILSDFSPALSVLLGTPGQNASIKQQANALFSLADQFLNSSDKDDSLNSKELLDLSVHLFSALKQSQRLFQELSPVCQTEPISPCLAQKLLEDERLLSPYPRFQEYIFKQTRGRYQEKIQSVLGDIEGSAFSSMDLLPLFFLIQLMETNYHLLDSDQSFSLESRELLSLAHAFKNAVYVNIPYIHSEKQAVSYIMYSLKVGSLPFFTGSSEDPIKFSHWHLNPQSRKPFTITANDFHFLLFDLYNLYTKF